MYMSLFCCCSPMSVDASVLNRVKQRAKSCTKTQILHKGHGVEPTAAYRVDHQMSTNTYLQRSVTYGLIWLPMSLRGPGRTIK